MGEGGEEKDTESEEATCNEISGTLIFKIASEVLFLSQD